MTCSTHLKKTLHLCICCFCCCSASQEQIFHHVVCHDTHAIKTWVHNKGNINIADQHNTPLIIHMVKSRNVSLLRFLLHQKHLLVNAQDQHGKTALDYAVDLDNINEESPICLQHMQYEMCKTLVRYGCKVTSIKTDTKLRDLLLKGKPKYDKTMLGFCIHHSPALISQAATYSMPSFFGAFINTAANFTGSLIIYCIDRIAEFRRIKKYNKTFLLQPTT